MCAFAANSLLNRAALADQSIDAASFTAVRIVTGAVVLLAVVRLARTGHRRPGGSAMGALTLFGYGALFSWAYRSITAATGALLLFAAVQCTMLTVAWFRGERWTAWQGCGLALSAFGLVWLLMPNLDRPELGPAVVMLLAGVCWGIYSLVGVRRDDPLSSTAGNFLGAAPLAVAFMALNASSYHVSARGLVLATVSGAVTSGLGYALWYQVLPKLGSFRASVVQLAVPALSALSGTVLLGEPLTARLIVAEALVLGGIGAALRARHAAGR